MDNQCSFTCPICGNTDVHSIGYINGKPYCRRCISFCGVWIPGNTKTITERRNYEQEKDL